MGTRKEEDRPPVTRLLLDSRKLTSSFLPPPFLRAVIVGYLNADSMMKEHHSHIEHIKEENGGELPERVVYVSFLSGVVRKLVGRS